MENFNGNISSIKTELFANRAFNYGDAVFDTLKYTHHKVEFIEEHYFRLMAAMRIMRMEIPMNFTLEFYEAELLKSIDFSSNADQHRIRVTIYRDSEGLYRPTSNKINYVIKTTPLKQVNYERYEVDIFKDFFISSTFLSTIKTTNRVLNVLASIYADENQLQNCLLLNEHKQVVEAINGNLFVVVNHKIITPPLSEGCINGIYRRKLIAQIQDKSSYQLIEKPLIYSDLLNASEVFITNSIVGIQSVTHFKKKIYTIEIAQKLRQLMSLI